MVKIGSNINSLRAQRILADSTYALSRSLERLSSGQRINRASDDAAGLAIASQLRANSRVFTQAIRNVNDGLSMLNIGQGGLDQLSNLATRIKELAEQSANGVYSNAQRRPLGAEADALTSEFNRLAGSLRFNGRLVLQPSAGGLNIQAGIGNSANLGFQLAGSLARRVGTGGFGEVVLPEGSLGSGSDFLTQGDFNGDGRVDIVSGGSAGDYQLFLGYPADSGEPEPYLKADAIAAGAQILSMAAVDFNGDGRDELVIHQTDGFVVIREYDGASFNLAQAYDLGGVQVADGQKKTMAVADFNLDGNLDLAVADTYESSVEILIGDGNFNFDTTKVFTDSGPWDVQAGDFNNDGIMDLVVAEEQSVLILDGVGNGTFHKGSSYYFDTLGVRTLTVGDLDRDGNLDILAGGTNGESLAILKGNGNGNIQLSSIIEGDIFSSFQLGDLDNDGVLDLVSSRRNGAAYSLLGRGDGTFGTATTIQGLSSITSVELFDLNQDGVLDVALGDQSSGLYSANGQTQQTSNIAFFNLRTRSGALQALDDIELVQERIRKELGNIGSFQSRLGTALSHLYSTQENVESALGRIVDADIAYESANTARLTILQQTGQAVLAQANLQPQLSLLLLR